LMSCPSWEGWHVARPGFMGRSRECGGEPVGTAMVWPPASARSPNHPASRRALQPPPRGLRFCEPWLPVSVGSGEDLGLGVSRNGTVAIASCPGAPTYGWVLLRRTRLWRFFVGRNRTSYEYSLLICSHV
jgi:hypothetical protein